MADPANRGALTLGYEGAGPTTMRLSTASDWTGRVVRYGYEPNNPADPNRRLKTVTDREGHATTFCYEGGTTGPNCTGGTSQRLIGLKDARGSMALATEYDPRGRVRAQQDAPGQPTTFRYDSHWDSTATTVTYPPASFLGAETLQVTDSYDSQGRVVRHTSKLSASAGASTNWAAAMAASQSTTDSDAAASRAVDGDSNGIWVGNSVARTTAQLQPWWQVDLGQSRAIGAVTLWSCTDCASGALSNFKVGVSEDGQTWLWSATVPGEVSTRASLLVARTGRYVKVQLNDTGSARPLALAEVEVWNQPQATSTNQALNQAASQSSTSGAAAASRAVDGNTSGNAADGSVAQTNAERQPWWQVDLGTVRELDSLDLRSCADCGASLSDVFVSVWDSNDDPNVWTTYLPGAALAYTHVPVGRTGRYVKIELADTGDPMSLRSLALAEVQAWSPPEGSTWATEQYQYNASNHRTSATDARGYTTTLCYDVDYDGLAVANSRGNLTRRIDPAPNGTNRTVTLFKYDGKNNLVQTISPKGVNSGNGVPNSQTNPCDASLGVSATLYATDLAYDLDTETKLETVTRRYTNPELGQQTAVTKLEYQDANNPGLVTMAIPPRGNTGPTPNNDYATTFAYFTTGTKAGLLDRVTGPLLSDGTHSQTTYDYDDVGRQTRMVDPNGNASGGVPSEHTWESGYDNEDRLRFVKAPPPASGGSQLVTELTYDAVGNREVAIDANGQVTKYVYDQRDSLQEVQQSPDAWTWPNRAEPLPAPPASVVRTTDSYDNLGNLAQVKRARYVPGDPANDERGVDYAHDGLNVPAHGDPVPGLADPDPDAAHPVS